MKFAILLEECATAEELQRMVPDHVAYLDQLHERGILIAAGPFRNAGGGLILIDVEDEACARAIAEEEPFAASGVVEYSLRSWEILTAVRQELLTRDG